MNVMCARITKTLLALMVSIALVASVGVSPVPSASLAHADDLSDAKATLDGVSQQLTSISAEYNELQNQAAALDAEIAATTAEVMRAQQAMISGQKTLGSTIVASYKNEETTSLVNVFLSSSDIAEFLKNIQYYSSIQESQAEKVEQQKNLRNSFTDALKALDEKKDDQDQLLAAAAAKKAEAERVVAEASAKVSAIESEQARLAELQAQAQQMQDAQNNSSSQPIDPDWNTRPGGDGGSGGDSGGSQEGWQTGVASAYGGSTDPYTPNPGRTATGAICDDNSWGVAIPMAWSNYRSYFGRAVEISYGGKTVVATVNDCGGLGGGSRSLDLQPGVWKAFGFSSCQGWGLRTVSYRFL